MSGRRSKITKCGRQTVFSKTQEDDMANQIKLSAKIFYGCTAREIKRMAYGYAVKNNVPNNFNNATQIAGKDWLKGFMKRNNLSIRKAEETRITSVQDSGKVVAEKDQKRVGSITSGERGQTVTAVCAMSATGIFVPPMLIYPRQRHSVALETDGPRGALYRCSKNGWINEDLFVDWLKHFANHAKPSEKDPILLILDNHSSHISLKAYEFCKSNNIVMLKAFQKVATIPKAEAGFKAAGIYPYNPDVFTKEDFLAAEFLNSNDLTPHSSEHRDRDNKTPESQLMTNQQNKISVCNIPDNLILHSFEHREIDNKTPESQLITGPQNEISSPETVCSSPSLLNETTHDCPTNSFWMVESLSNLALEKINSETFSSMTFTTATPTAIAGFSFIGLPITAVKTTLACSSACTDTSSSAFSTTTGTSNFLSIASSKCLTNVKDLLPVPKKSIEKRKSNRKQHATYITGNKKTAHTVKKRILQEKNNTSSSSESDVEMIDLYKYTDIEENSDLENKCVLCDDYGRNNELWYRCVICGLWAHAECTGSDTPENYMCDICIRKA
ncbi:unnamed protein product, partial [Brenthis ino]